MILHHIGIAAKDIIESIKTLKNIYEIKSVSELVYDVNQNAHLCMLTLHDNSKIELIQGSVVEKLLKKRIFLYHTCYETNEFEKTMKKFIINGSVIISEPKEAILFEGRRVVFLMTDMGIVELLEGMEE